MADWLWPEIRGVKAPKTVEAGPVEMPGLYSNEVDKVRNLAKQKQVILNQMMGDVSREHGLAGYEGSAKSIESMTNKVARKVKEDPGYNLYSMKDHARGVIYLNDFSEVPKVIDALRKKTNLKGEVFIEEPLNNTGYRGIHLTTDLGDGINGEIQLHTKKSWEIKKVTDEIYQKWRNVDYKSLTSEQRIQRAADNELSNKLWDDYFAAIDPEIKRAASSSVNGLAMNISPHLPSNGTHLPLSNTKAGLPSLSGSMSKSLPDSSRLNRDAMTGSPPTSIISDTSGETIGPKAFNVETPEPRSILESPMVEPQNIEMPNPGKMSEPVEMPSPYPEGNKMLSTQDDVNAFVDEALSAGGGSINKRLKLRAVTLEEANTIKTITGENVSNYTHEINNADLRHAKNQHGDAAVEAKRGQLPITEDDLKRIPEVINSYDRIQAGSTAGRGRKSIVYVKRVNGTIYYVEVLNSKNKTLNSKTMWKAPSAADDVALKTPPVYTSETGGGLTPSSPSITPEQVNVNVETPRPEVKAPETPAPEGVVKADRVAEIEAEQKAILDRIKARAKARENGNLGIVADNPLDDLADAVHYGALGIEKGLNKFSDWSKEMVNDLGDWVKPRLEELWQRSQGLLNDKKASRSESNILEGINPGELKDISPFSTGARDVYRNFKAVFGKDYDLIKSRLLDKFDDAKLDNVVYQEDWLKRLNEEVVDRLGITKDSKLSELVQRYGEGGRTYYDPKTNKVVKEPYTLEDLMRDAPNDWEKVVEADEWFRKAYDDIIDQVNAVKKEIYPGALSAMQKIEAKIADLKDPQKWTREAQAQAIHEIEWELKMLRESPRRRSTEDTQLMQSLEEKIKRIKEEPRYDSEYRETRIKALEVELDKAMRRYNEPKRSDYYRRYRELGDTFEGIKNIFDSPANIDPHLEGVSAFTQPKSRWASFMQKRGVGPYKEDAVGGFLNYLEPASYAIHIDPFVSRFSNLADDLADATATTGQANNFIRFLREYSQDLAGKTNSLDRWFQDNIPGGRMAFKALNWLNSRIKANLVLGNAQAVVAQLAKVPQGLAFAKQYSAEGFGRAVKSIFQEDPAMAASGFLKERYSGQMYQEFNTKLLDKPKDFAVWVMNTADKIGTNFIWQSAYAKGVAEKVANPVRFADAETRRLVAGSGIGEAPLVQKSKVFQLVAPFQLEVGNLWHVMKDMVSEKDFGGLAILFVANWMFNRGAEQVRGAPVTFDPIQAMIDAFQEEDTTPLQKAGRLGGEVLSNIPLGQTAAAALFDESTRKKYFGKEDPTRYGVGPLVAKGIQDPLTRLLLPYGGAQVDKTIQGAGALKKGAVYQGDTTVDLLKDWLLGSDDTEMKYLVEPDAVNLIKGLLFGPSGLSETKEYYDNNRRPLSEKQTQAVERSSNPKAVYERIIRQRNIDNLRSKINEVVKDKSLSQEAKKKRIEELRGRLKKVAGGG